MNELLGIKPASVSTTTSSLSSIKTNSSSTTTSTTSSTTSTTSFNVQKPSIFASIVNQNANANPNTIVRTQQVGSSTFNK